MNTNSIDSQKPAPKKRGRKPKNASLLNGTIESTSDTNLLNNDNTNIVFTIKESLNSNEIFNNDNNIVENENNIDKPIIKKEGE